MLQAQSLYANADKAWAGARQETLEAYAALVKALGGGWASDGQQPPNLTRR
jgi:outer membrane protein TolC